SAARYEREHAAAPEAVLARWQGYQAWHPTRHFTGTKAEQEAEHARDLQQQIRAKQCQETLAELRRQAADPDADSEQVGQQFQTFGVNYPEVNVDGDLQQLRAAIKGRRDEQVSQRAQHAFDELVAAEQQSGDLLAMVGQATRFLRDYEGTSHESEVRQ